jgi:UDP-GlcNAc:undecaprenyl-phosphate GlcNAc-1-phosphate transferase
MNFPINVYLAAFFGGLITTLVTLPFWRRWCLRTGLVDDPGHRKIHHTPIPLAGGLAVLTGILVPLVGAFIASMLRAQFQGVDELTYGLEQRVFQLGAIVFGAVTVVVLGWLDDKHELKPLPKFAGQLFVASLIAAAGIRITLFVPSPAFSFAMTVLWLVTVMNAFNFMDNMNGLCSGLGAIGAGYFAAISAMHGHYLVAGLAFLTCGALIGFLPYNFPSARAFLGDAGSHLTGYLLGVMAILPHFHTPENPRRWAVLTPLLVLAVPLLDLARVVIVRWRMGKPFYVGDTNHISHRLVQAGFSKTKAVVILWICAVLIGATALI